jgi:hypothetical protein
MKKSILRFVTAALSVIVATFYCSLMSSPISYGLPLNCPEGSRVIGIECFDGADNNTTPWYRREMGASIYTFPYWLAGFTAVAVWISVANGRNAKKHGKATETTSGTSALTQAAHPSKAPAARSKKWLPANCPHCGGTLSVGSVEWIASYEAKCPFCGSTLKE